MNALLRCSPRLLVHVVFATLELAIVRDTALSGGGSEQ